MHRASVVAIAIIMSGVGLACAQTVPATTSAPATSPATAPATAPSPEALAVLKMLEDRGATLKDFHAKLRYEVEHVRDGTTEINRGEAAYIKDAGGAARVAILLDDLVVGGAVAQKNLDHRFVFDGTWLIEKDPQKKIYRQIQLVADGVKANPFKLRGPLPMPIGQKVGDVLHDFAATFVPVAKTDPAGTAHLTLIPTREGVFNFKQLDLWVDQSEKVQLPIKLVQTGLDDNTTSILLRDMQPNTGDAEKSPIFDITPPPAGGGWVIDRRPIEPKPTTAPGTP